MICLTGEKVTDSYMGNMEMAWKNVNGDGEEMVECHIYWRMTEGIWNGREGCHGMMEVIFRGVLNVGELTGRELN